MPEKGTNRKLSIKEREMLKKVLDGDLDINTKKAQDLLNRPHVAISFNALLDNSGLSDNKLAKRAKEVIFRKPTKNIGKNGKVSSNVTTVDANALQAIRMVWQAKGKFKEQHEVHHSGQIASASDEQLDNLINSGVSYLRRRGVELDDSDNN